MSELQDLTTLEFPNSPKEIRTNAEIRKSVVCGSAYLTFAFEEADIEHDRNTVAAMTVSSTHNLSLCYTVEEYLEHAITEIGAAENMIEEEIDEDLGWYTAELYEIRKQIEDVKENL